MTDQANTDIADAIQRLKQCRARARDGRTWALQMAEADQLEGLAKAM